MSDDGGALALIAGYDVLDFRGDFSEFVVDVLHVNTNILVVASEVVQLVIEGYPVIDARMVVDFFEKIETSLSICDVVFEILPVKTLTEGILWRGRRTGSSWGATLSFVFGSRALFFFFFAVVGNDDDSGPG